MTSTTSVLLIPGTHAWGYSNQPQWYEPGSPLVTFLEANGLRLLGKDCPYTWSTALDGMGVFHRTAKQHIVWESAGINLYAYLANRLVPDDYVPIADRNVVCHSHAAQVAIYACAHGLKINRLLTMGSPVRDDMRDVTHKARPNIAHWRHLHSDGSDRLQWLGELFDGHLGIVRNQPFADVNLGVPAVAHSNLLNDPDLFNLWARDGLIDFLKGVTYAPSGFR